jgi:hypothetical protein
MWLGWGNNKYMQNVGGNILENEEGDGSIICR